MTVSRLSLAATDFNCSLPRNFLESIGEGSVTFNPSLAYFSRMEICAFRTRQPKLRNRPPQEWLMHLGQAPINIGVEMKERRGVEVKDPKISNLGDTPMVTFNSGYEVGCQNRIFMWDLAADEILELFFSDRRKTEKNWAPFLHNGEVYFLYSLVPLTILRIGHRTRSRLYLETVPLKINSQPTSNLTIGTPLSGGDGGNVEGIAHEKHYPLSKFAGRLYLGRPFSMEVHNCAQGLFVALDVGKSRMLHSWRQTIETKRRERANPNLLGCTYFSGLTRRGSETLVSYGVNDREGYVCSLNVTQWGEI